TASRLHSGHSDRVFLGMPVAIGIRSCRFRSRPGAQLGLGKFPSEKIPLAALETSHAVFDTARKTPAVIPDMNVHLHCEISRKGEMALQLNTCSTRWVRTFYLACQYYGITGLMARIGLPSATINRANCSFSGCSNIGAPVV